MLKKVLFLCTHNSCRSQMVEGLVNHYLGDRFEACSAGTEATQVNSRAIRAMTELDIDITGNHSKTMDQFTGETFDQVITLCGDANETCPLFQGGVPRMHIGFDDPSRASGSDAEIMAAFRQVRDEMKTRIIDYLGGVA